MSIKSITIGGKAVKKITLNGGTWFEKSGGGDEPAVLLSWEHVLWSIENNRYTTDYSVGDLIPLDLGTEGKINMQIVAFDADDRADGNGKAHISFISKELLATSHRMNPAVSPSSAPYNEGTGAVGGWERSEMRSYLKNTIKPLIRSDVLSSIVEAKKYTGDCDTSGTRFKDSESEDDVWIPSDREIAGGTDYETKSPRYGVFQYSTTRQKMKVNDSSITNWWLRSAGSAAGFRYVNNNGGVGNRAASNTYGVALGFCL